MKEKPLEINKAEVFDTEHRDCITCPKCGESDPDSHEFTDLAETKVPGKCGDCGQVFDVIRHVTVTYSTILNVKHMRPQ